MSRKMLAWSTRFRARFTFGDQSTRWYSAELPNSRIDVSANTTHAQRASGPSATATSTSPATAANGAVNAWIQPRHVGLASRWAGSSASSTSGMCGGSTTAPAADRDCSTPSLSRMGRG